MNRRFELQKLHQGYLVIAGCDEVGRGSLAGPVVAAAVGFSESGLRNLDLWRTKIKDSKLLTEAARVSLSQNIRRSALVWGVGVVSPEKIDTVNIHHATLLAMSSAWRKLHVKLRPHSTKTFLVVDGKFSIPNIATEQTAIVDADAKIFSVACASILAKVYRDTLMEQLHKKYPRYNFAKHKGYGTMAHQQAIAQFGLSPIHRRTFCKHVLREQ